MVVLVRGVEERPRTRTHGEIGDIGSLPKRRDAKNARPPLLGFGNEFLFLAETTSPFALIDHHSLYAR